VKRPPVSFERVLQNFDENFIEDVRKYIGLAHLIKYEISEDVQKVGDVCIRDYFPIFR
jgi:hypothetical protein